MAIIYNLAASSSGLTCFLAPSPIALPPAVFWAAERSNLFVFWASDLFVFYHSDDDDDDDDDTNDYGDDNADDWGDDYSFSLALTPINKLDLFSEPLTICLSLILRLHNDVDDIPKVALSFAILAPSIFAKSLNAELDERAAFRGKPEKLHSCRQIWKQCS